MPLKQKPDPGAGQGAQIVRFFSQDITITACRSQETHQNIDCGGLTHSVLSEDAENLAFLNGKIEIPVDQLVAVAVCQIHTFNHIFHINSRFRLSFSVFNNLSSAIGQKQCHAGYCRLDSAPFVKSAGAVIYDYFAEKLREILTLLSSDTTKMLLKNKIASD